MDQRQQRNQYGLIFEMQSKMLGREGRLPAENGARLSWDWGKDSNAENLRVGLRRRRFIGLIGEVNVWREWINGSPGGEYAVVEMCGMAF
jgi:hypothetical protein